MADEKTVKTDVEEIAQETKAAGKEVKSLNSSIQRLGSRPLEFVVKRMREIGKQTGKANEVWQSTVKEMAGSMSDLEKAVGGAMTNNKKVSLAAGLALQTYVRQGEKAKDLLSETSKELQESTQEFKKLTESIFQNRLRLKQLEEQTKNRQATAQENSELQALNETLQEQQEQYAAVALKVQTAADASERYKQTVLESTKQGLAEVETIRMRNHELAVSQGGKEAVSGFFKQKAEGRMFKLAQDLMSGAAASAFFAVSVAKLNKALAETGDYAKAVGQVAVSMGQAPNLGFADSFSNASKAAAALMTTSGTLGLKLEEVSEAANKIRLGIRADKSGILSEEAIAGLTLEAAKFSKVAGVDLSTSVDLLEKRMKRFGMSAGEAQHDLMNMRVVLGQMTAGNKTNSVSMAEMIEMIEEASSASQSYVVDTRIMTQALRGAVNQSTLLGASQKEAKDIAKATGKIFSSAPEWVKIPAGHNLYNQLLGADSDKFIGQFNSATQKRLMSLRSAIKSGQVGAETASRELFDLIGSTEAGQEAQFKQMKHVLFTMSADGKRIIERNKEAALVIKEEFGLDNMAQAGLLTRMMQDAAEMQDMVYNDALKKGMNSKQAEDFVKKTVPFSTALAKQTMTFNESIETALKDGKDAVEVLKKQGASQQAAENYVKFYKEKAHLEKKYQEEVTAVENDRAMSQEAKERKLRDLRMKHFNEYTKEQQELGQEIIDPVRKAMNDLGLANESISIDVSDFEKIGVKNAKELANKFGISSSKNVDELEKLYSSTNADDRKLALERISQMRAAESQAAKEQEEFLNSFTTKLSGGLLDAFSFIVNKFLGGIGLAGPWLAGVTAALTGLAGVLTLLVGGKLVGGLIKNATEQGVIAGISKSLLGARGKRGGGMMGPDDDGGGGGLGGMGTEKDTKKTKERKKAERKEFRQRARGKFRDALGEFKTKGVRSKLEGLKSLGTSAKLLTQGLVGGFGGDEDPEEEGRRRGQQREEYRQQAKGKLKAALGEFKTKGVRSKLEGLKSLGSSAKLFTKGLKLSRGIPLVGSAVSAGLLAKNVWDLGSDVLSGQEIKASKLAEAGMNAASMVPFLGTAATLADMGLSMGGGYEKLDKAVGPIALPMATPEAQTITGASQALAVPVAPPGGSAPQAQSPGATQIARAMQGGPGGLSRLAGELQASPSLGGVSPDGSITLKIHNFLELLSDAKAVAARSSSPLFG